MSTGQFLNPQKSIFFKKFDFLGCGTIFKIEITFFLGVRAPKCFFWRKLLSIGTLYKKSQKVSDMLSYLYFDFRGQSTILDLFWNSLRAKIFKYFHLWDLVRAKNVIKKNFRKFCISQKKNRPRLISGRDMFIYFCMFFFPSRYLLKSWKQRRSEGTQSIY